ncbi:hypothetical protein M0R45_000532 [Rubus argutus]|uniref:Uncharacterized protein n=1 Tax=Rubus argutus TaxID=59490 RepID=A0AAW1VN48_RUBAR
MLKVAATAEQGEGGANDDSGGLGTTAQEASIGSGLGSLRRQELAAELDFARLWRGFAGTARARAGWALLTATIGLVLIGAEWVLFCGWVVIEVIDCGLGRDQKKEVCGELGLKFGYGLIMVMDLWWSWQ